MQEMEKPSPIRKFMEKTAKRKTFYISDVFAVFWLLLFLLVRPTWPEVVAFFHLIAFFLLLAVGAGAMVLLRRRIRGAVWQITG